MSVFEWNKGTGSFILVFFDKNQIKNPFQITSLLQKVFFECNTKLEIQSAIIQDETFTILINHGVLKMVDIYQFNGELMVSISKTLDALYGKNASIKYQVGWYPNLKTTKK